MNLQQQKINFIVYSPVVPVINGIRSTAINLILELSKICNLRVILITQKHEVSNDETPSFLKRNNIEFFKVTSDSVVSPQSFSEKMKVLFPYFLSNEKKIAMQIATICKQEIALYFGTSFDPIAYHLANELQNPFFFPADSITLFEKNKNASGNLRNFIKKLKIYIASKIEGRIHHSNFKKIFYVSLKDIECAQSSSNSKKAALCSIGAQRPTIFKDYQLGVKRDLIFTGVMNFGPNEEAALYIIDNLLPYSNSTFNIKIVGMNPTRLIKQRESHNVVVTGAVDDISEFLVKADIFVSPLFSGAGAKNKIIQSLAVGLIVVGSPDSFSGFGTLPPGAYIANSIQEFDSVINSILSLPPNELQIISDSAIDYISKNYSWSSSAEALLKDMSE